MRYAGTPIFTDKALQTITDQLTEFKHNQFELNHKIQYSHWCISNDTCPNYLTLHSTSPDMDQFKYKHNIRLQEILQRATQSITLLSIDHYNDQLNDITFKLDQTHIHLQNVTTPDKIQFIEHYSNKESKNKIKDTIIDNNE